MSNGIVVIGENCDIFARGDTFYGYTDSDIQIYESLIPSNFRYNSERLKIDI
jgi:hypothetical protein